MMASKLLNNGYIVTPSAIEVAGGSNITKVVYFPMALDPAPLTWLESLTNNSIDS
jgi:hypothetical protein